MLKYVSVPFGIRLPIPEKSLVLIAPIDTLKERFQKRESRPMNESELRLTEDAIKIYRRLESLIENYYIIDSSKDEEAVFSEAVKLLNLNRRAY